MSFAVDVLWSSLVFERSCETQLTSFCWVKHETQIFFPGKCITAQLTEIEGDSSTHICKQPFVKSNYEPWFTFLNPRLLPVSKLATNKAATSTWSKSNQTSLWTQEQLPHAWNTYTIKSHYEHSSNFLFMRKVGKHGQSHYNHALITMPLGLHKVASTHLLACLVVRKALM